MVAIFCTPRPLKQFLHRNVIGLQHMPRVLLAMASLDHAESAVPGAGIARATMNDTAVG